MFTGDVIHVCVMYSVSPLHAGAGQSVGAIDLPIQRERHTGWPHVQASGVKGAFRDWFHRHYLVNGADCSGKDAQAAELTDRVFGKSESGADGAGQAGAVAFSDARLLAFPVRSNVAPFVWVTCPEVLARLNRDLTLCHHTKRVPIIAPQNEYGYLSLDTRIKVPVVLEDLAVSPEEHSGESVKELALIFAGLAPDVRRLLVVSDSAFSFLVRTATEIQPQIKIDMDTGTAADGFLRYQELLPADSVLYTVVFFSQERADRDSDSDPSLRPEVIRDCVTRAISTHVQVGGDMTLGRGLMQVRWFPELAGTAGGDA